MTNKQVKAAYEKYKLRLQSYGQRDPENVYQSYSSKKRAAWQYCRDKCCELHGSFLSVVGYSCQQFTAGFTFKNEEGKKCFCYITRGHDYVVEVDDE